MNILEVKGRHVKFLVFAFIIIPLTVIITISEIICVEAARIIMDSKIKKVILENISHIRKLYFSID